MPLITRYLPSLMNRCEVLQMFSLLNLIHFCVAALHVRMYAYSEAKKYLFVMFLNSQKKVQITSHKSPLIESTCLMSFVYSLWIKKENMKSIGLIQKRRGNTNTRSNFKDIQSPSISPVVYYSKWYKYL